MFNLLWMDVLNKLANLLCLVIAAFYIIRTYLIPYIKETIEQRACELAMLEQEAHECSMRKGEIEREMHEYKNNAQELLKKIEQWKEAIALQEKQYAQERELIAMASQNYLKKRADGLCKDLLRRDIFSEVIKQTKQEALAFFKKTEMQKKYVHTIIHGLKEGHKT